ncbi:MAG: hypothetical protein WBG08_05855, partial [Litorimonas sp.]
MIRFRFFFRALAAIVLPVCLTACGTGADRADETLYVGATLITLDNGTARNALLVRDGRIAAVGPEDWLRVRNPGARLVDLTGRTVIPGVVDSHADVRGLARDAPDPALADDPL